MTEDCLISMFKNHINSDTTYIRYSNKFSEEFKIFVGSTIELLEEYDSRFYIKRLNMEYVNTNRNLEYFMKKEKNQLFKDAKVELNPEQIRDDNSFIDNIKQDLNSISENIESLNYVKNSLVNINSELQSLAIHNEGKQLNFKNMNSDTTKLLNNLQLTYSSGNGHLALGGDGRNNQIFLATWLSRQNKRNILEAVTFYAIEEPEAHLHPHQQRKLSKYLLDSISQQVFITTHSPHIASGFKPDKIVKLFLKDKDTKAAKGGCSKNFKLPFDDFGYRLDAITSDLFFVNVIFLVEGPSEKLFYTALSQALNIDLDKLNISIITVNGIGFKPYIKICKALEIPFVLRTDNDLSSKTKNGEKCYYQAGVSRVMGIFEEFFEDDDFISYWKYNKNENEWVGEKSDITDEAIKLQKCIRRKIENEYQLFLANVDLEEDLANSLISEQLKSFYETDSSYIVIKKMQERKAENMYKFLKENISILSTLKNDSIANPLWKVKELSEKVVMENG